jgi:diacylglycerol O-acyltransferase / wax synthase
MADAITALDGTFLELEDADHAAHMHIGGLLVFGPTAQGTAPAIDDVRRHLERRLDALPRYRQRLSREHPGRTGWPSWEPDERFDIVHHVHRAALPAPGGWEELLEWGGEFYSHRLDRTRPLWEIVVLEGLADGHWAMATKTHHCMVDGIGSVDAAHLLLDVAADAPEWTASPPQRPARGENHGPRLPVPGFVRAGASLLRHPERTPERLRRAAALAELVAREEISAAPHSSVNEPIGPDRLLRAIAVQLGEAKAVKRALGGTVNDVVLAAVAGGLRALLVHRGDDLPETLRAMVPVDVRGDDEHGAVLGNRIVSLFVDLPIAESETIARYERVREETVRTKGGMQALGAETLLDVAALAPPVLHSVFARTMFGTRLFNVTVTNVPGPQQPLYAFGAPLETVVPLVPLAADHGVGIAVMSYDGKLCFGVNADRESTSDVDVLAEGLTAELRELQTIAHALTRR